MIVLTADIFGYIKKLFENYVLVWLSAFGACVAWVCFPEMEYLYSTVGVLGVMSLDLLTKIYALSRQNGGLINAFKERHINSSKFAKGTLDKLVVFGVLLICCGLAYRISPIADLAIWFTQFVFALMFLRDLISIMENLSDAGIKGLDIFKRAVKKKLNDMTEEYGGDEDDSI